MGGLIELINRSMTRLCVKKTLDLPGSAKKTCNSHHISVNFVIFFKNKME